MASYQYDVFGGIRSQTGSSGNEFKFTGEQVDGTSLQYLRARYYDPAIGRFMSQDPVPGGNLYTYTDNNPVNRVDPFGLCFGLGDCGPIDDADNWAGDRASDVVDSSWHILTHPTTWINHADLNQDLAMAIAALSKCDRDQKEGGVVLYKNCNGGLARLISDALGGNTFTVGSFVFSPIDPPPEVIRHERAHVVQYDLAGMAFLPAYGVAAIIAAATGNTNIFERQADEMAGTHLYD